MQVNTYAGFYTFDSTNLKNIKTILFKKIQMKKLILFIAFILSISAFGQTKDDRAYLVKVGDKAPDFSIKMTTGKIVKLSDLKGKVVMLQFTASWCSVCRKEMPFIERDIWQKHKNNKNFTLMAIDRDEPRETVVKFARSIPATYPFGLDSKANIFALFAAREAGITRNVIIDKTGKIVFLTRLYDVKEFNKMTKVIDELLK